MASNIVEYFCALDRIKSGSPIRVDKNIKITNDAVSLEAGRKKGSIKKSRIEFSELILAIDEAAKEQDRKIECFDAKLADAKEKIHMLRRELDSALGRELSLLNELLTAKKLIRKMTGDRIVPMRAAVRNDL